MLFHVGIAAESWETASDGGGRACYGMKMVIDRRGDRVRPVRSDSSGLATGFSWQPLLRHRSLTEEARREKLQSELQERVRRGDFQTCCALKLGDGQRPRNKMTSS